MQYEAKQQRLQAIRDALLDELNREDALTLRKLEREELMKNVLRWLLGPTFRLYPQDKWHLPDVTLDLETLDLSAGANLEDTALAYYEDEDAENKQNKQNVKSEFYRPTIQFGEMVRFLHQAIEWENMIYVLYPYFWSYPDKPRWDFKQSLYHSDFAHRNFLRAGAARVVLPVRPGFERDFLNFVEGCVEGKPPQESPSQESPYMSIADEVEAMAKTNYPYTQDANAEKEEYMFTWENVPGRDSGRLQRYLRQEFYIAWAEDDATKITKSGDGKTIQVAINQESQGQSGGRVTGAISIALDKDKGVAVMQVTDSKSYDLSARQEEGKWKIYRQQNLVDTWYEFTPTGALDVVEGTVISG